MRFFVHFSTKILIFVWVILALTGCSDSKSYYYDAINKNVPNIPILSMNLTPILDIDTIEKYDSSALIPITFKIGVDHQMVTNIQKRLMQLGFMDDDKPTTFYSEMTANSVKKFQRQHNLEENGELTPELYDLLMSKDAKTYEVKRGLMGEDISVIQDRLYELSYLMEEVDVSGYFGEKTENAIKAMQRSNKLPTTGHIDLKTFTLLFSENVVPYTINRDSESYIIKKYQLRLSELGYYHDDISGIYNETFREAVRSYQYNNSQIVDGWINPSTKFSLDSKFARAFGIYFGQRNATVKKIQNQLVKLKYMRQNLVTSTFGEYTAQAIALFQKTNGLEVTGFVDGTTLEALFKEDAIPSEKGPVVQPSMFVMSTADIKKLARIDEPIGSVEDFIKVAELKIGSKYVWAAKGPNTFDCSGFVYWCLNQIGVNVPYMTTYNWRFSTRFDKVENFDDLAPGDLIIINGHMGIVCNNDTVIDASSSNGGVVHRDLDDWWRKRFLMGFRIFKNQGGKENE